MVAATNLESATLCMCGTGTEQARARESFLAAESVAPGTVRQPILASWTRSRLGSVPTDGFEPRFATELDLESELVRAADPVLRDIADQLANEPVSMILCGADGIVLRRHTSDSGLERTLDQVSLAPGFSYAERDAGTNGIGTALEGRGLALVFGHEHYVERLERLACAGVPIRHPISRKLLGIVDLTCWHRDAGSTMAVTVPALARQIEDSLLARTRSRERALFDDYLKACSRSRSAVLALGEDLLLMNDRTRQLLDATDQTALLARGAEALRSGRRHHLTVDLPSGLTARVRCQPTEDTSQGGVLLVHTVAASTSGGGRTSTAPPAPTLNTAVGSSPAWRTVCQAVDRHLRTREWLILEGEPGTGKTTLARATHQTRTPTAHLRLLDADDFGPGWIDEVDAELRTGGSLILTHLDRLPAEGVEALATSLEPHRESTDPEHPWVVATVTTHDDQPASCDLSALLSCFPRTVEVPALRHHVEDIEDLVAHLLARLTRGAGLTCSPEAMRLLKRNRWPGNVGQLHQVLRKIVTKRRVGLVQLTDLPPECHAASRRRLTPIEAMECDAIVGALLAAGGNKGEAARRLGMSRATIFRKVRAYGIATP